MSSPQNGFRARLLSRDWVAGTFINLGSPLTAEIAGKAGFDWLMIDQEHGPGSDETLLAQLQAIAGTPATAVVRIAANETVRFKRVLDLGAGGVMVPYVNTEAEAKAAVAAVRYPPRGIRGVSKFNRAAGFGQDFDDYFAHAHERVVTIAQIESVEALKNVEAIAAVDGIDALFVGPLDLSVNLGVAGQFDHAIMVEARKKVAEACRKAGKAAGLLLASPAGIPAAKSEGFTLIALSSDGGAVATGLRATAAALRA